MKHLPALPALALALAAANPAHADPRIRTIDYDPAAVIRLDGCFGFQTMVEFADDERIENIGIGEASQWLISPNKRANMLFVKPSYKTTHSNMTVATDRRRYAFELIARDTEACRRGQVAYTLRFTYPNAPPTVLSGGSTAEADLPAAAAEPVLPPPEARNAAYTFSGARENIPMRVFDNGRSTFFRWVEGTTTPAVYAIGADKTETLVNFSSQRDYLVVDQVAPAFIMRRGNAVATLFNDAYQTPALDSASPQPRAVQVAEAKRRPSLFGHRSARP